MTQASMTQYTGTKTVSARPMNRAEYNVYRGWELPADENGADEGYLVEYHDGGRANDSRHQGYISWSPADVFHKAYRPSGSHQDRVRNERDDREGELARLSVFISTDKFRELPVEEQERMLEQRRIMAALVHVLGRRIEVFPA